MKFRMPEAFTEDGKHVHAIIETPRGSRNKYAFDRKNGFFWLKKTLEADMQFPCDMGFIPRTKGGDEDPLDILVLMSRETYPGCAVECRLLGVVEAAQTSRKGKKERNDRFIAVPAEFAGKVKEICDPKKDPLKSIIHFFKTYNRREGKEFDVVGIHSARKAKEIIKKCSR